MTDAGFRAALGKAESLVELRRYDQALAEADAAIALDPQHARARCVRSMVLFRLERNQEALDEAGRALGLDPTQEWAHRLRAAALLALHAPVDLAVQAASAAVSIDHSSWRGHKSLADAYLRAGRTYDAGAEGQRIVALAPRDAEALLAAADLAKVVPGLDQEALLRAALALDPLSYRATINLGALVFNSGRKAEGQQLFLAAARLSPTEATPGRNLLLSLRGRGLRRLDPRIAKAVKPLLQQERAARRTLRKQHAKASLPAIPLLAALVGIVVISNRDAGTPGYLAMAALAGFVLVCGRLMQNANVRFQAAERAQSGRLPKPHRFDARQRRLALVAAIGIGVAIIAVTSPGNVPDAPTTLPPGVVIPRGYPQPGVSQDPASQVQAAGCLLEQQQWNDAVGTWQVTHPEQLPTMAAVFPERLEPKGPDGSDRFTIDASGQVVAIPGSGC